MIYSAPSTTCYKYSVLLLLICGLSVCQSFSLPPSATTSTTTTASAMRTTIAPPASTTTDPFFDTHTHNKGITERTLFKLGSLKRLGKKIAAQHQYQLQSTVMGETSTLMPTTTQTMSTSTSTLLLDRPPQLTVVSPPAPTPMKQSTIPKPSKRRKILIEDSISSLSELKYFLEDDERPVVIK